MNFVTKLAIAFVAVSILAAMWVHMWVFKIIETIIETIMDNKSKNLPSEEDDE